MQRGGRRPGAGRKKGFKAIEAEKAREYLTQRVAENLEPLLTALIEAAIGIWYEETIGGEKVRVYKKEPDLKAGEYLLNQVNGVHEFILSEVLLRMKLRRTLLRAQQKYGVHRARTP